jgi:amino acid transporter
MTSPTQSRPLRFFFVLMVMFGITTTVHGLAPLATYGLASAFFLLVVGVGFLIPAGMAASELATSHQEDGGVFLWVSAAFGEDTGFLATWLQWLQNVIFWTVILTGSAAMLAIGFGWDAGANNKLYTVAVVVGTVWFASLLTMFGMKSTGWAATIGSLAGTILPGLALIIFAVVYLVQGQPSNMSFAPETFFPDLSQPSTLAFAISTLLVFAGIELMGTRVREIYRPERTYPRATFGAIALSLLLLVPTVLAVAVLVPSSELNIAAGFVQAVETVFTSVWFLPWVPALFAIALLIDSVGEITGWMAGTPIAMAKASEKGYLPVRFSRISNDAARPMLVAQAVFGSMISIAFVLIPTVQGVFWVLSALLVQLYLLMYILLFASTFRLRQTQPDLRRPWRIPGGWAGVGIVCGVGAMFSAAAFLIGFFPPALLDLSPINYVAVLGAGLVLSIGAPVILILLRKRRASSPTAEFVTLGPEQVD